MERRSYDTTDLGTTLTIAAAYGLTKDSMSTVIGNALGQNTGDPLIETVVLLGTAEAHEAFSKAEGYED